MTVSVAIVGSGPAGFYTAEALLQSDIDVEIDIIDRLPTPFGLIRAGVAPDHQKTKKIIRAFEKTALKPGIGFFGSIELGRDVSVDELRGIYDAVVLAIGAGGDRPLNVPGADKNGVIGSAAFVGWYNGHPDFHELAPDLDVEAAVVIGNGNVAIDIARVLVKTPGRDGMPTDLARPCRRRQSTQSPLTDVYICFGRRGPVEAKFTNVELREMGKLETAAPIVEADDVPDAVTGDWSDRDRRLKDKNLATLRDFAAMDAAGRPQRVHFTFFAAPTQVLGGERVEAVRFEHTQLVDGKVKGTGDTFDIACGLVVPAIGYRCAAACSFAAARSSRRSSHWPTLTTA